MIKKQRLEELRLLRAIATASNASARYGHEWHCDCALCFDVFTKIQTAGFAYHEWLRQQNQQLTE